MELGLPRPSELGGKTRLKILTKCFIYSKSGDNILLILIVKLHQSQFCFKFESLRDKFDVRTLEASFLLSNRLQRDKLTSVDCN